MSDDGPITAEDVTGFPEVFTSSRRARHHTAGELVEEWGPLTEEHVAAVREHLEAGSPTLGVETPRLERIRANHHRMAQLIALGEKEVDVARVCSISPARVMSLRHDPAFQELVAHYRAEAAAKWEGFVEKAAALSEDLVTELHQRLNESPEEFTIGHLTEATKVIADRAGHAPVARSVNLNVNADMGTRLQEARKRAIEHERQKLLANG